MTYASVWKYEPRLGGRELLGNTRVGDQRRGVRIIQHEREARRRVGRIHRDVGAPRLQNSQCADHHIERPRQAQPHQDVRTHAERSEMVRQAVGAGIEFTIGQRVGPSREGERGRSRGRLRPHPLQDASTLRIKRAEHSSTPST